jgi:predicted nucleotidyltransferase
MSLNGMEFNMEEINNRREFSAAQFLKLQAALTEAIALAAKKACVCATGSYGRQEAGQKSDLDLFIVSKTKDVEFEKGTETQAESLLSNLDAICIKANLINTTKIFNIPDFDGDGRYLEHYTVHKLTTTLGKPEDDALNTFTARLLLLLESTSMIALLMR